MSDLFYLRLVRTRSRTRLGQSLHKNVVNCSSRLEQQFIYAIELSWINLQAVEERKYNSMSILLGMHGNQTGNSPLGWTGWTSTRSSWVYLLTHGFMNIRGQCNLQVVLKCWGSLIAWTYRLSTCSIDVQYLCNTFLLSWNKLQRLCNNLHLD